MKVQTILAPLAAVVVALGSGKVVADTADSSDLPSTLDMAVLHLAAVSDFYTGPKPDGADLGQPGQGSAGGGLGSASRDASGTVDRTSREGVNDTRSTTGPLAPAETGVPVSPPLNTPPFRHETDSPYQRMALGNGTPGPYRASRIVGMKVVSPASERLGSIEDLVLDREGRVAYAIVSVGGIFGMGDRLRAVPWKALRYQAENGPHFVLNASRSALGKAPGFSPRHWPDMQSPGWINENRKYY
ncbi:PRC-barrel domain-containing protein [Gulbenkiania mobilis]|uniref:PRC-barrel domain protein n=1 Tax=Gulbenkiania mobilis TaxID=397457 RepID=A0ABY2D0L0_GULMO|nr:PRC-barrel domain protein [Gulbenkiania mobilis]